MRHITTTLIDQNRPLWNDWTVGDVLAWIAADDGRCHDESLRPLLEAMDAALDPARITTLQAPATVALVRSLASHVRTRPALCGMRLDELGPEPFTSPARVPLAPSPASAPAAA